MIYAIYHTRFGHFITYIYLHEFTHTVEEPAGLGLNDYHTVLRSYTNTDELEITKLYLLNQATLYGKSEIRGIPYSFWKGEMEVRVQYDFAFVDGVTYGGTVEGEKIQYVPFGGTASAVTAVPKNSLFRFVKWSDGVTTATRKDTNITSYLVVTAIFERI